MQTISVKNLLSVLFLITFLSGCASSDKSHIRQVRVGMDKAAVLDLVGNPTRTARDQGQDRWTYNDAERGEIYVYFSEGKVTHIGSPKDAPEKFTPLATPPEKFKPIGN